jgi:two-component system chemotaxis response regulator CheB
MGSRNIIVIGASAGGFEALKKVVKKLPPDLGASIFVVWHIPPNVTGILPEVLNRAGQIPAANAIDGEAIEPNRIYVAPPDHHLLVEPGRVRVTKGPRENRFRPAVDPLFRSAAYAYNHEVIGVILSGALDDGTSGLWTVKHRGGLAIVQDPADAEFPSMPRNALDEVSVDHIVPASEIAALLVRVSEEEIVTPEVCMEEDKLTETEIKIAMEDSGFENNIMDFGDLTPFTCPDCHGVLTRLKDGERNRFRCHTGHAFSGDSLLVALTENIEDNLYNAIRGIEESVMLLNHIGNHLANNNQINLSALYFKKAFEAEQRIENIRQSVLHHERLSLDKLREQADGGENNAGSEKGNGRVRKENTSETKRQKIAESE